MQAYTSLSTPALMGVSSPRRGLRLTAVALMAGGRRDLAVSSQPFQGTFEAIGETHVAYVADVLQDEGAAGA